jgi:hypothetical protein
MGMIRALSLAGALLLLAACGKAEAPVDTCRTPDFAAKATSGTFAGEKEAAMLCVKRAAFAMVKAGQPLPGIAEAAMIQCKPAEAAMGKTDPLEDWQRKALHETLTHVAERTATQARSTGCGQRPGEAKDTI